MAKQAIILHGGSPGPNELRLGRMLDFFGVPWKRVDVSKPGDLGGISLECTVFGPADAVAIALNQRQGDSSAASRPAAFYAYAADPKSSCGDALQSLFGNSNLSLQEAPGGNHSVSISETPADLTGPMAGLKASLQLRREDSVLTGVPSGEESKFSTVVSAGDAAVFLRGERDGVPVFFCTSSQMVDIDEPVRQGFYDIKDHFCSVVPLVMFIRFMFPDVAWRPQELGACLIIDDPLLRLRYGFCDFPKLRDLMRERGFTTNIAFIPWNWRRTSPTASDFFRREAHFFSVSIHGCDHTAGEFGTTSIETLRTNVRLAKSRMRNHESRTGVQHDAIMVFPQGVFSSACPAVLRANGFLAAVNTEIVPVDSSNARTRIRDVWDVAIMTYGGFPIFTRRYAFHGLENFAFDLLLGKPCLIVAHHDFFKDGGAGLIELVEKIKSRNPRMHWRPLGELVRRACRRRATGAGTEEIEMYASELLLSNPTGQTIEVKIRKRQSQDERISEILCDGKPVKWASEAAQHAFGERISPHAERRFRVVYQEQADTTNPHRSLGLELSVAMRRILSEFRDHYLSTNPILTVPAQRLKAVLRRAV